ncbi:hypothetical protein LUZ60_007897 [Juncus effusus]|nr:hypothetical protein LUZ60_007897 [Juncus effusus]
MASVSTTFVNFGCSFNQAKFVKKSCILQANRNCSVSLGITNRAIRTSRLRVACAAKPETVTKVMEVVKKQLALDDNTPLTPESTFTQLGADSLDTVEIVMGLEEVFDITVEEDNSQNIATVQDAADLIDKLVEQKAQA